MAWPKGKKRECKTPGSGRKPGTGNSAATVRAAVMMAFDRLGGIEYLVKVGKDNPAVFITLLGRILPHELAAREGELRHEIVLKWVTPEIAKARGWLETPAETEEETPHAENGAGSSSN